MFSRRLVLASLVSSLALVACATGTLATSSTDGDGDGTADAGKHFDGGNGAGEGGSLADSGIGIGGGKDGGAKTDGGASTPIDSGTTAPPVDSGTTPPALCTGTMSSRQDPYYGVNDYDAWCDDVVYESGYDFPCATNSDCDGIYTVPACCFKGSKSTYCYKDTSPKGTPQCVPK